MAGHPVRYGTGWRILWTDANGVRGCVGQGVAQHPAFGA